MSHHSPFAANVVPKLVVRVTSLRPSTSAMSSLDSLTPKTYPQNQNVSCQLPYSRSYIDSKFTCPTPHNKGTADLRDGWGGSPPCLVWTCSHNHRLTLLFQISRFSPQYGMVGLKVAILGLKIAKKWGFSPLKFVRGHVRTPLQEINYFSTYRVVWQSFAKIGPGTSKIWWTEKIK